MHKLGKTFYYNSFCTLDIENPVSKSTLAAKRRFSTNLSVSVLSGAVLTRGNRGTPNFYMIKLGSLTATTHCFSNSITTYSSLNSYVYPYMSLPLKMSFLLTWKLTASNFLSD